MKRILIVATLLISSVAHAQTLKYVSHDVRKPWRGNVEVDVTVQIDAGGCTAEAGEHHGRPSLAYRRCMARQNRKLSRVERLPRQYNRQEPASDYMPMDTSTPSSPPPDMTPPPPPPPYEPPPTVDIHPFCADTIC